jgi:predicted aldo/keto reductase-like oxidoreductase
MTRARIAARSAEQIDPTDALLAGKVQRKVSNGIAGLAAAGSSRHRQKTRQSLPAQASCNLAVGTKVRLPSGDFRSIADAVANSLEGSLARLRLDRIDIFHLHNAITETGGGEALSVRQALGDVVPAFERLRQRARHVSLGSPQSATPR